MSTEQTAQYASPSLPTDRDYEGLLAKAMMGKPLPAELPEPWRTIHATAQTAIAKGRNPISAYDLAVHEHLDGEADEVWQRIAQATHGVPTGASATEHREIHWAKEAFEPQPPIDWIVQEVFSAASVSLVVGPGGTAKTYILLDLAVATGLGEPWLNRATKQSPVLFVDEESGSRRLKHRLHLVLKGRDAGRNTPVAFMTLPQFNLRDEKELSELRIHIEQTQAKLVIIDALADIMPGGDENAVKDVQPVFRGLRSIADATGSAIVIIHHASKSGDYRGSTAMQGAVDLMLMVEKDGDRIRIESVKERDVDKFTLGADAHWDDEQFWLTPLDQASLTGERRKFGKPAKYVLRYLAEHGKTELPQLMNHADICASKSARDALYKLVLEGYAERVDGGGQGTVATYALTDAGKDLVSELGLS